jgi:Transglycosylase-like domain
MSIFDTIAQAESSNRNVGGPTTSSGQAQGYYQITTGTWQDFAPRAGVSLAQYPTALDAPADVQTQVASVIPLSRWAPSTQQAVFAQYGAVDPTQTLGVINAQNGGGTLATTGVNTGGASTTPSGGLINNPDELGLPGISQPAAGSGVTVAPDAGTSAVPIGLAPNLAKGITDMFQQGVVAPLKALFGSLADWFTRGALIIVGLGILAVALWSILAPQGMKPADVAALAMRA